MTSSMKAPALCWVPPDTRCRMARVPVALSSTVSWLSPCTQRQSPPSVTTCVTPSVFDHCTDPPAEVVGTCWSRDMRPMLRGGVDGGTARKVL